MARYPTSQLARWLANWLTGQPWLSCKTNGRWPHGFFTVTDWFFSAKSGGQLRDCGDLHPHHPAYTAGNVSICVIACHMFFYSHGLGFFEPGYGFLTVIDGFFYNTIPTQGAPVYRRPP